jgi:predicted TIM-barrel fold metal-dependent hydrolase
MNDSGVSLPDGDSTVIDPGLPIVDCHHHLWAHPGKRYLIEEFSADIASGHNVISTVYVECDAMYRRSGPALERPLGEAEFVGGMAAMSESGLYGSARICAGFVGKVDFRSGVEVDRLLVQLKLTSGGRLRGIRGAAAWDADASINTGIRPFAPRGLLMDAEFRRGVARLVQHGLVYDAWQYYPQLGELCSLADALPDLKVIVNHCGGLLGMNAYANDENFARWRTLVSEVALRPNTFMKLGGLSPKRCGFGFDRRADRATAEELARLWHPYITTCIELFGPKRCMFESNFPPDRVSGSYRTLWNALKLTAAGSSADEKHALFSQTATSVYRLDT